MSDEKTIKNFWMIFIAGLAMILIVMAIATASLEVSPSDTDNAQTAAPIDSPARTSPAPASWSERVMGWIFAFLLTVILSGRFILLVGVLLFYGFIISYVAPQAVERLKARLWRKSAKARAEKTTPPTEKLK